MKEHVLKACEIGSGSKNLVKVTNLSTLVQLVASDMGSTVVPQMAVESLIDSNTLLRRERFEEAMALYRKTLTVAHRVLGKNSELTLGMRTNYAMAFCADPAATLDDLREAITTLEESKRIVRRVFGGDHPLTSSIEGGLRQARALLCAREIQSSR